MGHRACRQHGAATRAQKCRGRPCHGGVGLPSDGPSVSAGALEVRKTLQEITLGRPATDAMRDLGERNGALELKRFTDNIVQSERMGISVADSLRTLARDSRVRRRQAAEEMARKAPIKMVPVLIFCVLPALGVVVMTPAAILLVRTLSQATPK